MGPNAGGSLNLSSCRTVVENIVVIVYTVRCSIQYIYSVRGSVHTTCNICMCTICTHHIWRGVALGSFSSMLYIHMFFHVCDK